KPKLNAANKKEDFTRITFKPDLSKFGMTEIDADTEALLIKRVYDLAGSVKNIKVFLNGERIIVKNFKQYCELYFKGEMADRETKPTLIYENVNDRWEVGVCASDGQFQQVSFVNSICTTKGGTHVNYITDQLVREITESIKKKMKQANIPKPAQIKNHLWVFVNCLIENPSFDSQTKETLTLQRNSFGSTASLSEEFVKKVLKTDIVESLVNYMKVKQEQQLRKTDGHKRSRVSGITKLDDANHAGTRFGANCTLILTEGDSAKTLAVSGLSVVGRDSYGVFPLRGKLLNVRDANLKQVFENQELNHIKQILGLQHAKEYTSTDSLRYGRLMIMTDQDHDGSHIKGLIINFLDHFYPSLLKLPGFLFEFITPIVKATKGKSREISFYTIPEYETWKAANNNGKGWIIKYYKGLGTSTAEDARKYFSKMDQHRKPFTSADEDDHRLIDMAFNKKRADDRKQWLANFTPGTFMDHSTDEIQIKDFINKELILFSMADNIRSIPSVVDGLKPGQRKILFSCFKRNLKGEMRVAQLTGYVAEHSAYHHGEQSLSSTIVGLAQDYVGSNNINLLVPAGCFGTRLQGGKDAASPRYIFTGLSELARKIFRKEDDALLTYLNEDGQSIEPEWYLPILPMILVNGAEGIGTGWSCKLPNYNPEDIVNNLLRKMRGEEYEKMHPWYRGFKGEIVEESEGSYKVTGIIQQISNTSLEITELPIGVWTQSYKELLEEFMTGSDKGKKEPFIKDYKEYHTDTSVHFVVNLTEENMKKVLEEGLENKFKLSKTFKTTNMVLFNSELKITKYATINKIMDDFYKLRLEYYEKRKEWLASELSKGCEQLENKVRFVTEIIEGKLIIQNRKRNVIIRTLKERGYSAFFENSEVKESDEEDNSTATANDVEGFGYLLNMSIWHLTWEKVEQLKKERDVKQNQLDILKNKSPQDLWKEDLEEFVISWKEMDAKKAEDSSSGKGKKPAKSSPKKRTVKKPAPAPPAKVILLEDSDKDYTV
ncbi:2429_t:CDS:10, partial [Paraglomus occultum]